ncbi:vitamin K-dependent protein Z isoform X2 [Sorex araneus]|uniref:vitamin K-dependent protein Z isoform X2 n=1 Tax=Sorex araneus TaxID=42254 RepID=UPI0003317052|nr:vitamin K-dependent protein Z isoform X2 [Sorex araneus]
MAGCLLLLLILVLALGPCRALPSVFLPAPTAHGVLGRWRRASSYLLEEVFEGNLEKECYEELCVYEEAREVFEHDEDTARFWKQYLGGSPCVSQPCLHGGSCQDHIRGYTCTCAAGFEGTHCAFAKNLCYPQRPDGCAHFCQPGPSSFSCSCAHGHRLAQDRRACEPHDKCACGVLSPQGCRTAPTGGQSTMAFPWQVRLRNTAGTAFCAGVVVDKSFVLTTASCALLHTNISVETRLQGARGEVVVRRRHVHPRYDQDSGENDLSLLELAQPLRCPEMGRPICTPEGDFAEHVLVPGTDGLLSGWTHDGSELGELPTLLPVTLLDSGECASTLNVTVTTRTYCERAGVGLCWGAGSAVVRQHLGTWFLSGLLSWASPDQPAVLLTKVSRYALWFRQVMG